MKQRKSNYLLLIIAVTIISIQACKTKKLVQKSEPVVAEATPPVEQKVTEAPAAQTPPPVMAVEKPDYNFSNIQFEFNSGILKTNSYPMLDKAAVEIKKDPSANFVLNGYASAEGTDEHNMLLSAERANSVKLYLVNSGVKISSLSTKGYGESNPVASNNTEAGKQLNRRVEVKIVR